MAARKPMSISAARPLSIQLSSALATWSTSQRTVVGLAADLADSGEWAEAGVASAAHWISEVADIEVSTAREWIRIGRLLRSLPAIANAFLADELSYSKVRTLTRIAPRPTKSSFSRSLRPFLRVILAEPLPHGRIAQAVTTNSPVSTRRSAR